jgi:hypothetical protein
MERRRSQPVEPTGPIVGSRAAPSADGPEDARRIFEILNWVQAQPPDLVLATIGAKGGERLAIRWTQQKHVALGLPAPTSTATVRPRRSGPMTSFWRWSPPAASPWPDRLSRVGAHGRPCGALNLALEAHARAIRRPAIRPCAG